MAPEPTPVPTISVVIVAYRQGEALRPTLAALAEQLRDGDELIVVDNASGDATPDVVRDTAPNATLIASATNAGFPAACNLAAERAAGDLLVFLNPDAVPAAGWREAIARPLADGSEWTAWQALVTAEGGRVVNTRGGVVHFTGIAWAGGAGEPIAPPDADERPGTDAIGGVPGRSSREGGGPGFVSGACLAIPRAAFARLGGFAQDFFLYHEDVDLSLRVGLAGGALGVAAGARVDHEYEFHKGKEKWRHLERNRWATLLRTYPAALLLLLAPALAATELALLVVALVGGWLPQKLAAYRDTVASLPRLARERRAVQAMRTVGAGEFARALTPALDSPYLGAASRSALLGALLRGYWRAVLWLLGVRGLPRP